MRKPKNMSGARILVLKQEGLRQFVEAEPAFAAIRAGNPGIPIDLLTTPEFGRLAKAAPFFDRVLAAPTALDGQTYKQLVNQLKTIGYEQVYDLDGSKLTLELRSAMTGFRGPRWVGPKRVMSRGGRAATGFAGPAMRKLLADANVYIEHRLPDLTWSLSGHGEASTLHPSFFGVSGPFAMFIPAAMPGRRWPAQAYAELAQSLAAEGLIAVVVGDEAMGEFADEILQKATKKGRADMAESIVNLCGKADLAQVAMMARHAAFFVAGVSEELHLCLSVGCPGIVLLHPDEGAESDSLFGRDVIKLTAQDMSKLSPDTAVMMLRNMGLIAQEQQRSTRAYR